MGQQQSSIQHVSTLRREYGKIGLEEDKMLKCPFEQFKQWFEEAVHSQVPEPNAMCLSTADPHNFHPSSRIVLLKGFDKEGFVFFTNYDSQKAKDLDAHPWASLCFWWQSLERMVRIEGKVGKTTDAENDEYFKSRPFRSKLGAWASDQSQPIENREALEQKMASVQNSYLETQEVPRPPNWGGFRLVPEKIEFWKGRESRLHDRIVYILQDGNWSIKRLQP